MAKALSSGKLKSATKLKSAFSFVAWIALGPLSLLYAATMRLRNFAYDRGILKTYEVGLPVIGIGNLTAGGTGKTPLTAFLIEQLLSRGLKPGVVSRGYGGRVKSGSRRVPVDDIRASALGYGDEPAWLATSYPSVPVYVGPDKVLSAQVAFANEDIQIVLVDDAFQHRRLRRTFDIVVIDATQPGWHYRPLPWGRLREGFASLERADAVVISKINLVGNETLRRLRLRVEANVRKGTAIVEMKAEIPSFSRLSPSGNGENVPARTLGGKRLVLISGIGRPETFRRLVGEATQALIADHLVFADHHLYSEEDFVEMNTRAKALAADYIVMTEKDAVKVTGRVFACPALVSRLVARPVHGANDDMGALYEALSRSCCQVL